MVEASQVSKKSSRQSMASCLALIPVRSRCALAPVSVLEFRIHSVKSFDSLNPRLKWLQMVWFTVRSSLVSWLYGLNWFHFASIRACFAISYLCSLLLLDSALCLPRYGQCRGTFCLSSKHFLIWILDLLRDASMKSLVTSPTMIGGWLK